MRVVLIVPRFPAPSETFIAALFKRLLERGWDVHVVCHESRADDLALFPELTDVRDRIHVAWPRAPRWAVAALIPLALIRCLARAPRRTIRYIRRGFGALGLKVFARLYADTEVLILDPDLVHFQFGVFAVRRERIGDLVGCAMVVSFQGADLNYAGLEKEPGYYAEVWKRADAIHFLGDDLRRRAERRGYVTDERAMVIKPGVDTTRFSPMVRTSAAGRPLRILSVGRLHWKKGYEYAMAAIRGLIDAGVACEYRVIGDGDFRPAVESAIKRCGVEEHVELLGVRSLDEVREEMQRADVLLHSAVSEGFCYVAIEAQAMELAVVTSDADGLPENVVDGETGWVVPRRDADALAAKLTALARDEGRRHEMGQRGRYRAMHVFAPDRQIDECEELYRSAVARRG